MKSLKEVRKRSFSLFSSCRVRSNPNPIKEYQRSHYISGECNLSAELVLLGFKICFQIGPTRNSSFSAPNDQLTSTIGVTKRYSSEIGRFEHTNLSVRECCGQAAAKGCQNTDFLHVLPESEICMEKRATKVEKFGGIGEIGGRL